MEIDFFLTCKILNFHDLEVWSTGDRKLTIEVLALHRRKAEVFEISFYNKYISQTEKLDKFGIYKIGCIIRSEVFTEPKTEIKTYFTHIVGIYTERKGYT
ncbi:hypothetical protein C8D70_1259 [Chryseobacterium sp. CBTAP 102]|uniref:hypothetical protein n=1 Tax=Chryseobacterium sp. CBTAP 102 TaxID=2135644 RepID=UPI000D7591AD|nr:hypothetical protein [Chryseobacterium sp. CBTAP 102]PXW06477.1 hypothetical protein C8D70_1259 [Chryseobacterium sp. CBTAP 102]